MKFRADLLCNPTKNIKLFHTVTEILDTNVVKIWINGHNKKIKTSSVVIIVSDTPHWPAL